MTSPQLLWCLGDAFLVGSCPFSHTLQPAKEMECHSGVILLQELITQKTKRKAVFLSVVRKETPVNSKPTRSNSHALCFCFFVLFSFH